MKRKIIAIIFALIIAIGGIGMIGMGAEGSDVPLLNVANIDGTTMDSSCNYEIVDAIIIDNYATYEENNIPKTYYLAVGFYDSSNTLCMASMEMAPGDAIYQDVMNYLDDDSMYIGDLTLPLYVSASNFSMTSEVGEYFSEFALELTSYGYITEQVWLQMDYLGANMAEYEEEVASSSTGSTVMGVFFLVFAVVILILGFKSGKKTKARAAVQQPVYQAAAAQPVYQAPPQYQAPAQPQQPQRTTGVCPTCGEAVKPGTAFCGNCGTRL